MNRLVLESCLRVTLEHHDEAYDKVGEDLKTLLSRGMNRAIPKRG